MNAIGAERTEKLHVGKQDFLINATVRTPSILEPKHHSNDLRSQLHDEPISTRHLRPGEFQAGTV